MTVSATASGGALGEFDLHLFGEGTHERLYEKLGAHVVRRPDGEVEGTRFAVWAPRALGVSVIGEFNGWHALATPLRPLGPSGVWEGFVPGVGPGALYKYSILAADGGSRVDKADPFAFASEAPAKSASRVADLGGYAWGDGDWMAGRAERNRLDRPITIYEVHLGSWRRFAGEGGAGRWPTYRELAGPLADYVHEMGFTHVELMPVAEHPFHGSWGYQQTGFFAPTARYGTPHDLMALIDALHWRGIGVILDWVAAHFPRDPHGLAEFDGAPLYEPADPDRRTNPAWDTNRFDYARPQVANFLLANALYWLDLYHADGLRVDAVEPMLYVDYGRATGGGRREDHAAMAFLRRFNERVHANHPGVLTIAEDSSARPGITRPAAEGGLGFDLKWDLGWVHDTVDQFLTREPSRRPEAHGKLVFRMHYAPNENYLLPLSHDEVVYAKGSLLGRMPGDEWQKFANLRLLYGYQFALTGKKLLFMGDEFGQRREWDHDNALQWHLRAEPPHAATARWVRDLNTTYRAELALHAGDAGGGGFAWIDASDAGQSILCFLRKSPDDREHVLVVANFTPTVHHNYRIGAPRAGRWEEILNGDAPLYGGSGQGNLGGVQTAPIGWHGQRQSLNLTLPPLAVIFLKGPGR